MGKRDFGRELWDRMCRFVETDDGLPFTSLGPWTADKLFHVCHYVALTTQAIAGNRQYFSALNYIDLFCGNGVCVVDRFDKLQRFPGSGLIAAGCEKPFDHLFVSDSEIQNVRALESRITRLGTKSQLHADVGDANDVVQRVVPELKARSLSIAFLDPFSLSIDFKTVQLLTANNRVDLIILFPDAMDIVRNVDEYYYPRKSMKLDRVIGEEYDWRTEYDKLQNRDGAKVREFFVNLYLKRIKSLGHTFVGTKEIRTKTGPIYKLVYACENDLGLKFWNIAGNVDLDGTRSLFAP